METPPTPENRKRVRTGEIYSSRKAAREGGEEEFMTTAAPAMPMAEQAPATMSNQLVTQLTLLGQQLSAVAERDTIAPAVASDNFQRIQREMIQAMTEAFNEAQAAAAERQTQREALERQGMEEAQQEVHENLRQRFLQRLNNLTLQMSTQLTYGEQTRIYDIILRALNERLTEDYVSRIETEPDYLARLSEVFTIAYNHALEQLAITLSNMYETAPEVTRQTISILTASLMLYPYQPDVIRTSYEAIPYFGIFFATMNRGNRVLSIVSNTAGTVTTLFYLLRNAGIDLTPTLTHLSRMGIAARDLCVREVATASATALDTSANFVCGLGIVAAQTIVETTAGIFVLLADRLGSYITSDYSNLRIAIEDGSSSSQGTDISGITNHSLLTGLSANSRASQVSVQSLLSRPIEDRGASINQNRDVIPNDIIQERFAIIVEGEPSNTIIASPIETANAPVQVAEVEEVIESSQGTIDSELTEDEEFHWSEWLFGRSSGGRRLRKSRRHMKMRRTRKGRRGRKRRMTKKGRKHHRTMKRYRSKGRR